MGELNLAEKLADVRLRISATAAGSLPVGPKFAQLARKDARIRVDQDAALSALAKELMGRRVVKVERITENTLIRVAIDLLLAHADELRGSTEEQLLASVTDVVRQSGTLEQPQLQTSQLRDVGGAAVREIPRRDPTSTTSTPAKLRSCPPRMSESSEHTGGAGKDAQSWLDKGARP